MKDENVICETFDFKENIDIGETKIDEILLEPESTKRIVSGPEESLIFTWKCDPKYKNLLLINNKHLIATSVDFEYGEISWRSRNDWPEYTTSCPRSDIISSYPYPKAKRHCVIIGIKDTYAGYCGGGATINSRTGKGQVFVTVNDGNYTNNTGFIYISITGWR